MIVGELCGHAAPWSPIQETDLNQERLVNLFNRVRFFGEGRGESVNADRTTLVFFNDCQQQAAIDFVETIAVHFEHLQRGLRCRQVDLPGTADLRIIAYTAEQAIGNSRSASRAAG